MNKLSTKDCVVVLLSISAIILGCWTVTENWIAMAQLAKEIKINAQQQLENWYMMFQRVLFILLGGVSLLRVLAAQRTVSLQKFFYGVGAAVAAVYTLLVIVDASSLMAMFIPHEMWNDITYVVELTMYILYLAIGITALALCVAAVREKTRHQQQLGMLLLVWIGLAVFPLFVFAVRYYQFNAGMWIRVVAGLAVQAVFQIGAAYGAFCHQRHEA